MSSMQNKILIMATKMEAEPFINGLDLTASGTAPMPVFQNRNLALVISGIGKTNAAMAATYACLKFLPAMVCNLGAAGGVDPSLNLGDTFQVSEILELDRPRWRNDGVFTHKPDTLNGIRTAMLATQDKPILSPDERNALSRHVQIVDMEAAPIVQVCKKFALPCHVFKFVSDTPAHTSGNDIMANIIQYRERFFFWFYETILPEMTGQKEAR
jgi:nucleoside phosphorylase